MLCKSTVSAIALSCLIRFSHSTDVKCAPSGSIQTADLFSLLTSVATNDFSPQVPDPFPFPSESSSNTHQGTAQFCIENDFIFENTHLSLHTIAAGAGEVITQCCADGSDTCNGGTNTIKGDSGLSLILTVQPSGGKCKASFQAGTTGIGAVLSDIGELLGNIAKAVEGIVNSD